MIDLLTVSDLARYLRLDPQTVSRKTQRGEIPGFKVGNRWRFRREEIDRWLSSFQKRDPFKKLRPYLKTRPEIKLVYLFGSRARGEAGLKSDTDLAVLFYEGTPSELQDQIAHDIAIRLDTEADVVGLNEASPLLKYEVISDGRLLYQGASDEEVINFELGIYREYYHTERIRRMQFEALGGDLDGF